MPSTSQETISLVLKGYTFQLILPYIQGQVLGQAEAGVLNREWTQAVRTGFQTVVEAAIDTHAGKLSHEAIASLQVDFQHFADEFSFKALSQSRNADPLTRAKHSIAKQILDIRLNARGTSRQAFGESRYEATLARLMNNHEVVRQAE